MGFCRPQGIRHSVASRRDPATRPKPHSQDVLGALPRLRAGRSAELGRAGERAAAGLLRSRGYHVVGAGFLARRGELDLICRRGPDALVLDGKTGATDAVGPPLQAVRIKEGTAPQNAAGERPDPGEL